MGSSQSSRKLTISNEEEVGVIKVSNALIQRLAQNERTAKDSESFSSERAGASTQHPPPPPPPPSSSPPPSTAPPQTPTTSSYPVFYYPELTMSAHHMRQQKDEELRRLDEYWQKRLQNLEESYQKINSILEEEYKKATSEATTKPGQKSDIQSAVPPCLDNSNKVLKCYQDHPKETLKCSSLVEQFSNCIWNAHYTRVLDARS